MIGHYASLCGYMGQIVASKGGVAVLEFRPDIRRWRYTKPGGSEKAPFDQPPPHEIARYFEEFWTGSEPLPVDNGLYVGRQLEVLSVALAGDVLRVTVRV